MITHRFVPNEAESLISSNFTNFSLDLKMIGPTLPLARRHGVIGLFDRMNWKHPLFVIAISCLCLSSIAQNQVPQLQAGKPVDTVIYNFTYGFDGSCLPLYDFIITIDQNLTPFVSGVNFYGVISALSPLLDSVYTDEAGFLHNGDTIWFSQSLTQYTFYYPLAAAIAIDIHLAGTPSIAFETYPCQLIMNCTLALCANTCQISAFDPPPFQCIVDDFSGSENIDEFTSCHIFPNPATGILNVQCSEVGNNLVDLRLYDSFGKLIHEQLQVNVDRNQEIFTSKFTPGIYYIVLSNDQKILKRDKLLLR
jgi:hypothetical protein